MQAAAFATLGFGRDRDNWRVSIIQSCLPLALLRHAAWPMQTAEVLVRGCEDLEWLAFGQADTRKVGVFRGVLEGIPLCL
jgi:hypothetical protein